MIAHCVLAFPSAFVFWARPGAFTHNLHVPRRAYALIVVLQSLIAFAPYIISGFYACSVLPARESKATSVFIAAAAGIAILGAGLILNWFKMREVPPTLLVLAGVTIAMLLTARLCATIGRSEVPPWDTRL